MELEKLKEMYPVNIYNAIENLSEKEQIDVIEIRRFDDYLKKQAKKISSLNIKVPVSFSSDKEEIIGFFYNVMNIYNPSYNSDSERKYEEEHGLFSPITLELVIGNMDDHYTVNSLYVENGFGGSDYPIIDTLSITHNLKEAEKWAYNHIMASVFQTMKIHNDRDFLGPVDLTGFRD